MTNGEWRALLGFGAVALLVSFFSGTAALVLIGTLGLTAVLTHGERVRQILGMQ